jgi:hypothetical protein
MHSLMYQNTAGQRFVSFPTAAQEFLYTATREHSKYTSLKWKFDEAMAAAADGNVPEGKLAQPLTNFFWSGLDRQIENRLKQEKKIKRGVEATKMKDDARARKQQERKRDKANKTKERGARKKRVSKRPAGSEDDSTEEDGKSGGKPLLRTCSDTM